MVLGLQHGNVGHQVLANVGGFHRATGLQSGFAAAQVLQSIDGQRHDAAWAMALVHQTFDDTQFFHLRHGVDALAVSITSWNWKAIATLPYTECVFANPGVALNSGDGECHLRMVIT